jgi:hypothetical protein
MHPALMRLEKAILDDKQRGWRTRRIENDRELEITDHRYGLRVAAKVMPPYRVGIFFRISPSLQDLGDAEYGRLVDTILPHLDGLQLSYDEINRVIGVGTIFEVYPTYQDALSGLEDALTELASFNNTHMGDLRELYYTYQLHWE